MKRATSELVLLLFIVLNVAFDQKAAADSIVVLVLTVTSPVTGGGSPARGNVWFSGQLSTQVIEFRSTNPALATVSALPQSTQGMAPFQVTTVPVTSPTPVTITAQIGTSSKSTVMQILPPKLSMLGCDRPARVTANRPLTCTASLDGKAAEAITVSLSSKLPAVLTVPSHVTIPKGASNETFQVLGKRLAPLALPTPTQVSATYQGVTKSVTVIVRPTR